MDVPVEVRQIEPCARALEATMRSRYLLLSLGLGLGLGAGCRDGQDTEKPESRATRAACCRSICACFGTEPPPEVWEAHRETVANCEKRGLDHKRCGCTDALECP